VTDTKRSAQPNDVDVYRALVEGIPAIFYIDNPDESSTNFYTSPQAVDLLGYTQQDWGNTPDLWIDTIHPDDVDRVLEENRRSNMVGDNFFAEYRMVARDGRTVWIRDEAVLERGEDGAPLHWRGLMLDITSQKEVEEELRRSVETLRRSSEQRRELMQRLESAQEGERRRIAADIHDDSIQVMSALDMRLQTMAMSGGADRASLEELHGIVLQAIERLRHLTFELRPAALDRDGLAVALRRYLEHTQAETGLEWSLDVQGLVSEPASELRAVLYRVAQEAVVNVRKHAKASRVDVAAADSGSGFELRIGDDGGGFDTSELPFSEPGHLGFATCMERAEVAGGWFRVSSTPGAGTSVAIWLPTEQLDEL
jgi:PAS domain S-box-containing protein